LSIEVTYIDHMGGDLSVVNSARVSFGKKHGEFEEEKDTKLIDYLGKHNHISPFHHTYITMHVKAPIFVARQLVKHEYMPWNEVSRRYVDDPPEFYAPDKWRERADNIKQGSGDTEVTFLRMRGLKEQTTHDAYNRYLTYSLDLYSDMLSSGVCPEQARMVLPQSLLTEWYWSGTLSAWAKMYNLRKTEYTQEETREVAMQAGEILKGLYPVAWEALTSE